ncbi:uncharacterized protein YukE [Rhodococcus sp. 27YEA15]|uniref:hypothetical protein n=1 Tax=Rhodococcus sp. 27YEA15 TaxID=3156259 RepID=UPI003C7C50FC
MAPILQVDVDALRQLAIDMAHAADTIHEFDLTQPATGAAESLESSSVAAISQNVSWSLREAYRHLAALVDQMATGTESAARIFEAAERSFTGALRRIH